MKKIIYIHTNNKQILGAYLAKYAIEKNLSDKSIIVKFLNVDELAPFKNFSGKKYLRGGKELVYDPNDLQSFTLSRFMPPEMNGYEGRAMVIDPDIFAIKDISPLFNMDMEGKSIICCAKKDAYDTSMMVLDCAKLRHWKMENILSDLVNKKVDYVDQMSLKKEITDHPNSIKTVERIYNNLDTLTPDTYLLHTTDRLTQPWRTGLKIDFIRNSPGKYFKIIPKKWLLKVRGKWPSKYQRHPDKNIEIFFLKLLKDALKTGKVSKKLLEEEVNKKHVRSDVFIALNSLKS